VAYDVNKAWLKCLVLFYLMILPLVPRYIGFEVRQNDGSPFLSVIRMVTLGLLTVWVFWVLFLAAIGRLGFSLRFASPVYQVFIWLVIYLGSVFIASLFSSDIKESTKFLLSENVFLGTFYFLILFSVFRYSRDVDNIFRVWLFSAIVVLILGFVESILRFSVFSLLDLPGRLELIQGFFDVKERAGFIRMQSTLDNPVALSAYLVMTFPFVVYFYNNTSSFFIKSTFAIFIWLIICAVVLTYVRSAWFFLGLSFFLMFFYRLKFLLTSALVGLFLLFLLEIAGFSVLNYVSHITETIVLQGERQVSKSTTYRIEMIEAGLNTLKQSPLVGVGPGLFGNVVEGMYYGERIKFKHHENFYITLLVEAGIIGFLAFMGAVFTVIRLIWRARNKENDIKIKSLYTAILLSTSNYLGMSFFLNSFSYYQLGFLFWTLLAAGLVVVDKRNSYILSRGKMLRRGDAADGIV